MAQDDKSGSSFWQTIPGMLTALAGVIAAITGLLTVLYQAGVIGNKQVPQPSAAPAINAASTQAPIKPESIPAPAAQIDVAVKPASGGSEVNLLASEYGGHLVATSGDDWINTIDGKEGLNQISYGLKTQNFAVFAFKGEQAARFDRFTMLITGTADNNVKEFELLASNESALSGFEPIGKFSTQNIKLMQTPYQEFRFPPVRAKFFKVRLISCYGSDHPNLQEIQLFGKVE